MPEINSSSFDLSPVIAPLGVSPGRAMLIAGMIQSGDDHAAEKAALARISRNTYPFPLIDLSGLGFKRRWVVRIQDIRSTMEQLAHGGVPSLFGVDSKREIHPSNSSSSYNPTNKGKGGRRRKISAEAF